MHRLRLARLLSRYSLAASKVWMVGCHVTVSVPTSRPSTATVTSVSCWLRVSWTDASEKVAKPS
ncbi:hypothetical protein D3C87_2081800 [compost metagenome]